jgi:hypothetical protein
VNTWDDAFANCNMLQEDEEVAGDEAEESDDDEVLDDEEEPFLSIEMMLLT